MTDERKIVGVYALHPAWQNGHIGKRLNCLSFVVKYQKSWTIYSVFAWDSTEENGLPGLTVITLPSGNMRDAERLTKASLEVGGYTNRSSGHLESVADFFGGDTPDLRLVEADSISRPEMICELFAGSRRYEAQSLGNFIHISELSV